LKFEHIVVVNEPENPLVDDLSREELWFGLLCRAEDPAAFLPGLERCVIVERADNILVRDLHFGSVCIRDTVAMQPMMSISFSSTATREHAGGQLTITIEEPEPGRLALRFQYRTTLPDTATDPDGKYAEYVKSAYHSADLETVRVIRQIIDSARMQ
jgi:hypothetical protein